MASTFLGTARLSVALLAAGALALTACGGGSSGSGSAPEPGPVTNGAVIMDLAGPLTSYDPAKGSGFQDAEAAWALYDSLISTDSTGKFIAGLASQWSSTPNSATFTLNAGVTCSDGTPVTGDVAAASVRRFLDPATASPFLNQATGGSNPATVAATGNRIVVTLQKPWVGLLPSLASPFAGIICPSGLKDPSMLKTSSAGTGAFVSDSQVAGSTYTFKRRTNYGWGPKYTESGSGGLPKTLVMKVLTDDNTRANLMQTSALQIGVFGSNAWTRFQQSKSVTTKVSPQTDIFLIFNEKPDHETADQSVRKAITQAVSREGMSKVQSFGAGQLISNLGEPSYKCYDKSLDSSIPKYDTAAASKVLKGKTLNVLGSNVAAGGVANSYVLAALEAAGAKGSVQNLDNSAYVTTLFSGTSQWDVAVLGYGNLLNSILATGGFFDGQAPPKGQNLGDVQDTAATQALKSAGTASSESAECAALSTFQKALITRSDVLPIGTIPVHVLFAGGTSGAVVKGFVQPSSIRVGK